MKPKIKKGLRIILIKSYVTKGAESLKEESKLNIVVTFSNVVNIRLLKSYDLFLLVTFLFITEVALKLQYKKNAFSYVSASCPQNIPFNVALNIRSLIHQGLGKKT